jgi:hypothetical protein
MIRALLELLARVLGDVDQAHDDVDLVPATCDDCGGPIGVVCCDLSDSLEYLEAANR